MPTSASARRRGNTTNQASHKEVEKSHRPSSGESGRSYSGESESSSRNSSRPSSSHKEHRDSHPSNVHRGQGKQRNEGGGDSRPRDKPGKPVNKPTQSQESAKGHSTANRPKTANGREDKVDQKKIIPVSVEESIGFVPLIIGLSNLQNKYYNPISDTFLPYCGLDINFRGKEIRYRNHKSFGQLDHMITSIMGRKGYKDFLLDDTGSGEKTQIILKTVLSRVDKIDKKLIEIIGLNKETIKKNAIYISKETLEHVLKNKRYQENMVSIKDHMKKTTDEKIKYIMNIPIKKSPDSNYDDWNGRDLLDIPESITDSTFESAYEKRFEANKHAMDEVNTYYATLMDKLDTVFFDGLKDHVCSDMEVELSDGTKKTGVPYNKLFEMDQDVVDLEICKHIKNILFVRFEMLWCHAKMFFSSYCGHRSDSKMYELVNEFICISMHLCIAPLFQKIFNMNLYSLSSRASHMVLKKDNDHNLSVYNGYYKNFDLIISSFFNSIKFTGVESDPDSSMRLDLYKGVNSSFSTDGGSPIFKKQLNFNSVGSAHKIDEVMNLIKTELHPVESRTLILKERNDIWSVSVNDKIMKFNSFIAKKKDFLSHEFAKKVVLDALYNDNAWFGQVMYGHLSEGKEPMKHSVILSFFRATENPIQKKAKTELDQGDQIFYNFDGNITEKKKSLFDKIFESVIVIKYIPVSARPQSANA
jgi:hypothetical protein